MDDFVFPPASQWIWSGDNSEQNVFLAFRKRIALASAPSAAVASITADSRYELYVNGQWIGNGPIRSWPSPWPVDTYPIEHLLRQGDNVIAVLVQHFGISTFQYLHEAPGLIAQAVYSDSSGEHIAGTDSSWRVTRHRGYQQTVPRICCQQAWEEQFDARVSPGPRWADPEFDDSDWPAAAVVRKPGEPPHERFEARDIPFLSVEAVSPERVVATQIVQPAPYTWSLNLRSLLNASDLSANMLIGSMLAASYIHSATAQQMQIHQPHFTKIEYKVNGIAAKFDEVDLQPTEGAVATVALEAGWNLLLARMPQLNHAWTLCANFWSSSPLHFAASPDPDIRSPWRVLGPFETPPSFDDIGWTNSSEFVRAEKTLPDATNARFETIWEVGALSDQDLEAAWSRSAPPSVIAAYDVYAACASERVVENAEPDMVDPAAIIGQTADWTIIGPSRDGDVRLLVDFGKEVVGFQEFEVQAPAGAILDFHNFEFIQRDGRINLSEGMNNSFRYVCREGYQAYRTFVRRGFRYSWISVRNLSSEIKIRGVRVIMNTYRQTGAGDFVCSDPALTEIWKVGAHSVRCCSEDTYTDCPSYEQTHWVGDARNEALVDLVVNGDPRLSRHCWIQAARSLDRSPLVESHVPSGWVNILPAWSFLWMRWAHEHYLMTGDREFARLALGFIDRNVDGFEKRLDSRGLLDIHAWNMFDWAQMDTPNDGIVTHQICLAVQGLKQAAALASLLDNAGLRDRWSALAEKTARSVDEHLWSDKRQAYVDSIHKDGRVSDTFSQQTQTAAYISGVATGERARRCREIIETPPEGFVTAGSPFYMFFVLEVFAREGRYDMMQQTIRDYWGPQIEAGATAFWEQYHPHAERLTRSHCHGWSSAPTFFLSQYILGVRPLEAGYNTLRIAPHPASLRWAHGRVSTPFGVVAVDWTRDEHRFDLRFETPAGHIADVVLPVEGDVHVVEGQARIASQNPPILEAFGGRVHVVVHKTDSPQSGSH